MSLMYSQSSDVHYLEPRSEETWLQEATVCMLVITLLLLVLLVYCTDVRSLTRDWRPQRDGSQKVKPGFRPRTSFGESCYRIHQ